TKDQAMMPDVDTFKSRFIEDYVKLFGRAVDGMDIEITVWSVNATTPHEEVKSIMENSHTKNTPSDGQRKLYDHQTEDFKVVDVVLRNNMIAGSSIDGPIIITEDETTIIVPANRTAICQSDGSIDMRLKVLK
ncbi:hydantoinase/oxoprolinase family protein, partial [Amylibacter sp.]|nr:hydantoinase/oxoprolinase family protein [Amylibacter sp.]